ncbi:conserved hypothetical protein [Pyrobaculum islandicum DSM 4184]|uniref:Uncharacterized protein n=1 Tax=Pyrobaculum islandicum (strain DSM 4184 / JCM 9189 / GEO3) TaxID=384616 RepID=A1RUY9_PYRIL|nr:hypothetical protein [Pyrobaculum islandicum]ABL88771.1 conserved hypothetical protein [Pyrobaculum islandicum DSM 4184]
MILQIVDYSESIHTLGDVRAIVSPRCKNPPPSPRLSSFCILAKAVKRIYGVEIFGALQDQIDLGLDVLDNVLLFGQLPLEDMWLARILPYGVAAGSCFTPRPDPIVATLAVLSVGIAPVAVDLRYGYGEYAHFLAERAEELGAEVQLIVVKPLELPGDIIFHSSAPPYLRERYIKTPGDVSIRRGEITLSKATVEENSTPTEPRFWDALKRVGEILNLDIDFFEDLASQSVLSHSYILDHITTWQLGYLAKWGFIKQVPGGWSSTPKLLYLYGLYRRR